MNQYIYKAYVTSVYDADTIIVKIDLGFGFSFDKLKIRLYGINAPEMRGEERNEGIISRDYLRELILDKEIYLETYKDEKGKYGRYLGTIYLNEENINEKLIKEGYAKIYS